jgi:SAM-dependent methyltransferase
VDWLDVLHGRTIHARRVRVLAERVVPWLPLQARVLDVGAGDGSLAARIAALRPDLRLHCVDVQVRPGTALPVERFDGAKLPFHDGAFDAVLIVDVLHHTLDPLALLREVRRVTRSRIVLKDHALEGAFAGVTLRLMDWIGNARHGVPLPFNYWPRAVWAEAFEKLGLAMREWNDHLAIYPWPAGLVFERSLQFLAVLEPGARSDA